MARATLFRHFVAILVTVVPGLNLSIADRYLTQQRIEREDHVFGFDLFDGFNDNCVLIHGNFTLRSMLKDSRSDQLLAMLGPGIMLWAPREYELFRLSDSGAAEGLLWHYLQRAPVAEAFLWRRWLYLLWDEVAQLVNTGRFNRANFDLATKSLLPWLA